MLGARQCATDERFLGCEASVSAMFHIGLPLRTSVAKLPPLFFIPPLTLGLGRLIMAVLQSLKKLWLPNSPGEICPSNVR